jgi:hypothetical protein
MRSPACAVIKVLRLGEYAARKPRRPAALQEALFAYLDAL